MCKEQDKFRKKCCFTLQTLISLHILPKSVECLYSLKPVETFMFYDVTVKECSMESEVSEL